MSFIFDKIVILQKFLTTLTWKKIAQSAVFFLVIISAWALFENRVSVLHFTIKDRISRNSPEKVTLSKSTQEEITTNVVRSDLIIGIQITVVDFQKNIRHVIYTSFDNSELNEIYSKFLNSTLSELPLFNSDESNNRRMVDLINSEFVCNPYSETIQSKLMPDSAGYIHTVCSTGIPPFYGKFTGIIGVYLKRAPTAVEVDQIRNLAKTMAAKIYDKDLK